MISLRAMLLLSVFVPAIGLGGCQFLAHDGPEGEAVTSGAAVTAATLPDGVAYALVNLDPQVVKAVNRSPGWIRHFSGWRATAAPDVSIGVGDIVSVTVFEAESGGLFIPKDAAARPGNLVQMPNQQVDRTGAITVPYVDQPVHVAGRTTGAVSAELVEKLKARAIEPQVIVTVVEHRGNNISVLGEVATPVRFSMEPGGIPLTGAIARAGGPKYPSYETQVTVKRNRSVQTADLTAVVKDPSQDIAMAPGDMVYLSHIPKVYMVLGATPSPGSIGGTNNRRFTFENETMTLAEAISKAGGLDSARSDDSEVFLFRFEDTDVLRSLPIDAAQFRSPRTPTVYKLNLASADGFFLASQLNIRDKDVIFVAQSASADLNQFLSIAVSTTQAGYNLGNAVYNFDHLN